MSVLEDALELTEGAAFRFADERTLMVAGAALMVANAHRIPKRTIDWRHGGATVVVMFRSLY